MLTFLCLKIVLVLSGELTAPECKNIVYCEMLKRNSQCDGLFVMTKTKEMGESFGNWNRRDYTMKTVVGECVRLS